MKSFKVTCENCGESVSINDAYSLGILGVSKLEITLDIDEEEPEFTEIDFNCLNCGNYLDLD